MPFGTANARLRKALLYSLAGRLDLLTCFRCSEAIDSIDDFSIEHKEPWESAPDPVAAFFSLENIAFSHSRCNFAAAKRPVARHGTWNMYKRHGCRCDVCRERQRQHSAKRYTPEKRQERYRRNGN